MLNREDVRKVLEARNKVINNFKFEDKEIADVSMKDMFELILGEIKKQEEIDRRVKDK